MRPIQGSSGLGHARWWSRVLFGGVECPRCRPVNASRDRTE